MSERRPTIGTAVVEATILGGGDPGEAVEAAEVGNNSRDGGAHDGLVEGRNEEGEHQTAHRQDSLTARQQHEFVGDAGGGT